MQVVLNVQVVVLKKMHQLQLLQLVLVHLVKKPHNPKRGSSGKHKTPHNNNNNTPGERKNEIVKFIPYSVGISLIIISAYLIYRKIKK